MNADPTLAPGLDRLTTPLVWADAGGRIDGSNAAFARWLGISARRLLNQPLAALEREGDGLRRALSVQPRTGEPLRLRRITLAYPGGEPAFCRCLAQPRTTTAAGC